VPKEVWQRPDVANQFLAERSRQMPDRDRQLDVMLRVLRLSPAAPRRVLDLGAGDALLLAFVLDAFPDACGVALDFSPPMLDAARRRLAAFGERATVVQGDFATPAWRGAVTGSFDAVVSGFAIHHLPHDRKCELFAEIYGVLSAGGAFVNCEHVASPTPRVERLFDEAMSEHLFQHRRERGEAVTAEAVLHEYLTRPDRAANILAPVDEQCRWLREMGFREVDCFWKWLELAVFGGLR
jgi:ubiquinone/menaquinone biosynthesis C-methylase UbiE